MARFDAAASDVGEKENAGFFIFGGFDDIMNLQMLMRFVGNQQLSMNVGDGGFLVVGAELVYLLSNSVAKSGLKSTFVFPSP